MTLQQFKQLKRKIDSLINALESEALQKGYSILSPAFEELVLKLKKKILAEKGISLKEYEEMELKVESEYDEEGLVEIAEKIKITKKNREQEINKIKEEFSGRIDNLPNITKKEILSMIESNKKPPQIINKIVKEIPQVIKTREIIREPDNKAIEEVQRDLFKLQSDYVDFVNRTKDFQKDIKIAKDFIKDIDGTVQGKITPEIEKFAKEIHSKLLWVHSSLQGKLSAHQDISGKENSLGNPPVDDYVLSSKTDGTRSWIAGGAGGGSLWEADGATHIKPQDGKLVKVANIDGALTTETDPDFNAWLLATPPLYPGGWYDAVQNTIGLSGFNNDEGYLTSVAFADLSDYPADAAGVLTNDGAGNLSWGAGGGASELSDLSDINTSTPTNRNVLVADGVDWESRALTEADISDLGTYSTDIHSNFADLENVSGTNTGDQTDISDFTGTMAEFDTACTDGSFAYSGGAFHDGFSDFVANEHIDWTNANDNLSTTGTVVGTIAINEQSDDYTLVLGDRGKLVDMNKGTAVTLTVPKNSSVAFPTGTTIAINQKGAGQVTIAPVDGDVTINSSAGLKLVNQYSGATLTKVAENTWYCHGDTEI